MLSRVDLSSPGVLPEKVRAWAFALARLANVSFEFALMTLLSAMSAALCGLKHVCRPDGGIEPLTLIIFGLAPPAYGKTRVFKRAYAAHMQEDAQRLLEYLRACEDSGGGNGESGARGRRDRGPRLRSVLLQDVSRYGLVEQLQGVGETVATATHEGNLVLQSNLFRQDGLEMATSLWDGGNAVQVRRGRGGRLIAMWATMPILVLVQQDIFDEYRSGHGKHARGIGFFDRTLFVSARLQWGATSEVPLVDTSCLEEYDNVARSFLKRAHAKAASVAFDGCEASALIGATSSNGDPSAEVRDCAEGTFGGALTDGGQMEFSGSETLVLSPEAAEVYGGYGQRLSTHDFTTAHLQGTIGRRMQNELRIAGLLQGFVDEDAPISAQCIVAAHAIVDYCLSEAAQLFPPEFRRIESRVGKLSPQEKQQQRLIDDAQTILRVCRELQQLRRDLSVALCEVRERCGIYPLRFRAALAWLIDTCRVKVVGEAKRERISVVPESAFGDELHFLQVPRR